MNKKKTHNGFGAIAWTLLGTLDAMQTGNNEVGGIMICIGIYYAVKWFRQPNSVRAEPVPSENGSTPQSIVARG